MARRGVTRRRPRARLSWWAGAAVVIGLATASPAPAAVAPPQIHTVAGGGSCAGAPFTLESGGTCDGIGATSSPIDAARSVTALPGGGYAYVDEVDDLVRDVSSSGVVTTVAGTWNSVLNEPSTQDSEGVAIDSGLDDPVSVSALPDGSLLVTEYAGSRVRLISRAFRAWRRSQPSPGCRPAPRPAHSPPRATTAVPARARRSSSTTRPTPSRRPMAVC